HAGAPLRLAFSSNGKQLLSAAADATVRLWDLSRPKTPRVFSGHTGPVYHVEFLARDRRLASASEDGTLRIWNPADGRELLRKDLPLSGRPAIAVAPAGDAAYVSRKTGDDGGAVSVWNLESGSEMGRLLVRSAAVEGLHLTFDGRFLISAESGDN